MITTGIIQDIEAQSTTIKFAVNIRCETCDETITTTRASIKIKYPKDFLPLRVTYENESLKVLTAEGTKVLEVDTLDEDFETLHTAVDGKIDAESYIKNHTDIHEDLIYLGVEIGCPNEDSGDHSLYASTDIECLGTSSENTPPKWVHVDSTVYYLGLFIYTVNIGYELHSYMDSRNTRYSSGFTKANSIVPIVNKLKGK